MKTHRFLLAAATLLAVSSATAADQTWLDANADNTWSTSALNWDAGVNWTNGNNAIFSGAGEAITASGTPTFTNLTFGGNYTISGTTSLAAAGIIDVASGMSVTMGDITGNKALTKTGAGTLTLNGTNFEGAISAVIVNGGILDIKTYGFLYYQAANFTGYTVNSGATLKLNGAYSMGVANGSGTVNKTVTLNNGTFVAQSSDMFVGDITLNNASTWTNTSNTVMMNKAAATASTVSVTGTGLSVISGTSFRLSGTQKFDVADTVAGSGSDLNVSSIIANDVTGTRNGGLTKLGAGTMQLSGANTYSGGTTISAGTLTLANSLALQNTTLTYNTGGGTLVFDQSVATKAFTLGGLSGNADIALVNNATTPAGIALTVGNNNASTSYSGIFSGAGSLIKTGTGTLTLSGVNTYTGTSTVSAGTLSINSNAALGAVATGAQLNLGSGSTLNTTATFALDNAGANKRIINLTGAATIDTATGTTLTAGKITGNQAFTKSGSGTLIFNGTAYDSAVNGVTVNGGTLDIRTGGGLQNGYGTDYTVNSGATLKLNGFYTLGYVGDGSGFVSKKVTLNNGTFITQLGALVAGDITLNNGSTWTNSAGFDTVMVNKAAPTASTVTVSGTGLSTIGNGSFRLSGTQKFDVADTVAGAGSDLTVSSIIANDTVARVGGFTKLGAGTMTLTANNTYSAGTTITAGTLNAANNTVGQRALGAGAVTINGGTLAINAATVGQVTLGTGATLTMTSGSIAIDITNASTFDKIVGDATAHFSLTGGQLVLNGFSGFEGTGSIGNSYNLITGFATTGNGIGLSISGYDNANWLASLDAATGTLTFQAIPEPSTYGLIGAGALAAVAVVRRRRKHTGKAA